MTVKFILGILAIALSGCATKVDVAAPNISSPIGMEPVKGNFAVQLQTGGWRLNVDTDGFTCAFQSFDADINAPYESVMRNALTRGLEHVTFVSATMTPDDIAKAGYDAQVVVYQGDANAKFGVQQRFIAAQSSAGVDITTTLAVIRKKGLTYQQTVTGNGYGGSGVFFCGDAGESVGKAASSAISDLSTKAVLYIRDALRS